MLQSGSSTACLRGTGPADASRSQFGPLCGLRADLARMRICIVTSYAAAAEPRGPRHAIAAKKAFPDAAVVFVDLAAAAQPRAADPPGLKASNIERRTLEFPTRGSDPARLAFRKAMTWLGRTGFASAGALHESVFGERTQGLTRALKKMPADIYIAHNIETLLPTMHAAKACGASVVFDCMEYYSDMGDSQHKVEAAAARRLEARCLPLCALVMASSDIMADALAEEYGIVRPLPAYNVPPKAFELPRRSGGGLNLYWRNTVVGFGQRGLDDMLEAMMLLPSDVRLFLQGRPPADNGAELAERIASLGLGGRINVLPPYASHEAVQQAALYDVGLCLERKGPRNHDLTVSNKMFDYHMAGLAVIATNLRGLANVVQKSGAGLLCEPGNPRSLADAVRQLHSSPARLKELQVNARTFAMAEANLEMEIEKIAGAMKTALDPDRGSGRLLQ